ncbi:hypothetical protein [Promicromonospora sp. NPDC023987]|uniref:hypothetical protein n=1 Tax=Promicromonospora sp. NPDC023987 TaxID=3155360 RepID=UPI0033EC0E9D
MNVTPSARNVVVPPVLLAGERDRNQLAQDRRRGSLVRIRRGAYCEPDTIRVAGAAAAPREERNKALACARALHSQLRSDHVFSHTTAALLLGCRVWTVPDRTHLYQGYRASGRAAKDVFRHRGDVAPDQVVTIDGLPVTSLARTVVDCALTLHPLEALVIVDSALRLGVRREDLLKLLEARAGRRGIRQAQLLIELGDAGAQSAWETWVRYEILRAGLPRPTAQMAVRTDLGLFHTDLGYPQWALGIEFDGLVKYRPDGVRPGHDPAREYMREKARAEAIRRAGIAIEHVNASDKRDVPALIARFARHLPPGLLASARPHPALPPT